MSRFARPARGGFATRTRASDLLRLLCGAALVAGFLALGCRIAPVVSDAHVGTTRYDDCEQAAQNYCEFVIHAAESDLEGCVANYAFQCISGASD
jgi:hypothetical protein